MGLWGSLGAAATGFQNEGTYLDQQAAKMRAEALQERMFLGTQEARHAEQLHAAEMLKATMEHTKQEAEIARLERESRHQLELDREAHDLKMKQMTEKFAVEHPELAGGSSTTKWLAELPIGARLEYLTGEKLLGSPLGLGETPESRLAQYNVSIENLHSRFPQYYQNLPKEKDVTDKFIEKYLGKAKTQSQAISLLNAAKRDRTMGPIIPLLDEDKIMTHMSGLEQDIPEGPPAPSTNWKLGQAVPRGTYGALGEGIGNVWNAYGLPGLPRGVEEPIPGAIGAGVGWRH